MTRASLFALAAGIVLTTALVCAWYGVEAVVQSQVWR